MPTSVEDYDRWYRTPRGAWIGGVERRLVAGMAARRAGESALDVGCGTGYFTEPLARAGGTVVGVDRSLEALDHARRHRGAGAMFVAADARSLPDPDRAFGLVISITALCFVDDERAALAELLRVARRRVVLGLLNRASVLHRTHGAGGGRGGYRGARWHTVGEARALFDDLPAGSIDVRTAVADPDGGAWARLLDRRRSARDGGRGAFIAVSADRR